MNHHAEPLAFDLYRRFRGGQTLEQLAGELGIPEDRIRLRVQAAAALWQLRAEIDPAWDSRACLSALSDQLSRQG